MSSGSLSIEASKNNTEFVLRRLHSLTGLLPLSLFLVFHLTANNAAIKGPEAFNFVVNTLRSIPYLEFVEISILGIPILFHGLYGLIITPNFARTDLVHYPKARNWTYFFQRITGVVIFVFIAVHIWQFRFNEELDFYAVANALKQPGWAIAYTVGIAATVYHFANGLWNFFISWGITVGKNAQRVSAVICTTIGFVVLGIGMSALWAFYSSPVASVEQVQSSERQAEKLNEGRISSSVQSTGLNTVQTGVTERNIKSQEAAKAIKGSPEASNQASQVLNQTTKN
ncbi:MAG: succinate dehydrogenase cytochrome b558 subunit [Candidatus Caenarcaniphilales bacterium]|nr:succinate dehydrogenase cytochrome b558 subunit [Candidatus Caenarcaniphilales bacterium]